MFVLFGKRHKIKKEEKEQLVLNFVKDTLFPQPFLHQVDGTEVFIDRSVDFNLQQVLIDLEDGTNDKIVQDTIRNMIDVLGEVRKKFNIRPDIKTKSTTVAYLVSANRD